MDQPIYYLYFILALTGLMVIIFTFFLKASWVQDKAKIKIDRFGIDLSIDNRTLFGLLGFFLLLTTVYSLYQHDKDVYQKAIEAKNRFSFAADHLQKLIEEEYDMQLNLDFDGVDLKYLSENPSFFNTVSINASFCSDHNEEPINLTEKMLREASKGIRLDRQEYGLMLNVKGVKSGDKLSLEAKKGKDVWRGEIVFPRVNFKLSSIQSKLEE